VHELDALVGGTSNLGIIPRQWQFLKSTVCLRRWRRQVYLFSRSGSSAPPSDIEALRNAQSKRQHPQEISGCWSCFLQHFCSYAPDSNFRSALTESNAIVLIRFRRHEVEAWIVSWCRRQEEYKRFQLPEERSCSFTSQYTTAKLNWHDTETHRSRSE